MCKYPGMISSQFPYFRHGFPRSNHGGQVAFYHPFLDRFLLVVPQEVEVVTKISMLANLRYPIMPMYVSNAPGFNHTLLDNGCCDNWTTSLDNQQRKKIYDNDRATQIIQRPQRLEPSKSMPEDYTVFSIEAEKQWMQLLWFWQEFLEFIGKTENPYEPVIDFVNQYLLPNELKPSYRTETEKFIRAVNRILSIETDPATADSAIINHMQTHASFLKDVVKWFRINRIECGL